MLVVYVDEFKLAGPSSYLKEGWARLRRGLDLDEPSPSGLYLGCLHERFAEDTKRSGIIYNTESQQYVALTGFSVAFVLSLLFFCPRTRIRPLLDVVLPAHCGGPMFANVLGVGSPST